MKIKFFFLFLSLFILSSSFFNIASATMVSTYHIGNSLTWDAIKKNTLIDLFANAGISLIENHHIKCSGTLTHSLANPDVTCVASSVGSWKEALAENSYDFLILQPSVGSHSLGEIATTEDEISAIRSFATKTNARLAIYEAFPYLNQAADISSFYHLPDQSLFRSTEVELAQIWDAFPNALKIPTMQVLINLDLLAREGNLPGMSTAQDFYRDGAHLNEFGRYALALTHFSALTGLDPSLTGLDLPEDYSSVTDQQALMVQKAVREVVLSHVPLPASILFFCTSFLVFVGFVKHKVD